MNRAMVAMGTRIYRRWRVYDREIGPAELGSSHAAKLRSS